MSLKPDDFDPTRDSAELRAPCPAIRRQLTPRQSDLGGFFVRRVLPSRQQRMVGPWIFFDHMGPADFAPGEGIDVRPHPHINLATVTYLFEGEIVHRDSLGFHLPIQPGDINLMVAGRGIVHSERTGPELRAAGHRVHGLQLWLALPEVAEEVEPSFHHYAASDLPTVMVGEVPVRVMIGEAFGARSPVRQHSPTLYLEADLKAGQTLRLPDGMAECAVYVAAGHLTVEGGKLPVHTMSVLSDTREIALHAEEDARIALIGGEPLGPRHIWWNFVSSRRERIEQAKADWRAGRFAPVPGETEFIPLPD